MDELTEKRIMKLAYTVLGQGAPVTIAHAVARPEYVEETVDELCDEWRGESEDAIDRVLRHQRTPDGVLVWRSPYWTGFEPAV
jgi:hypothetical protein